MLSNPIESHQVTPSGKIPSWLINPEQCFPAEAAGIPCLDIACETDTFAKMEWVLHLDAIEALRGRRAVVEIEFVDQGAGLIDARLAGASPHCREWGHPTRRASYTRLNTTVLRRAWFEFNLADNRIREPRLLVSGLRYLTGVSIAPEQPEEAWAGLKAAVPTHITPLITLERPIDLVTTAGLDVLGGFDTLEKSLDEAHELAPLAKLLGFTAIEAYVTWKRLEPDQEGTFDFSFYDAIVEKLATYDLKLFPLLIVGSEYALPEWYINRGESIGFECLEHGIANRIPSIWDPDHRRHVTRVLQAFGAHYEPMGILQGVRLGPSGNYGESQYPAGGNWGHAGDPMHIHIGWWAGDPCARADFRRYLREKYTEIGALNTAWETAFATFDEVEPTLPNSMYCLRRRLDFTDWYTTCMSQWCAWWAQEARKALPNTPIYQSAGGWGFREAGTHYVDQTRDMIPIQGGIRLTNEGDSFDENIYSTRLAATAARHYGIPLGYEPSSWHSARGTAGRIFNTATTNGRHFFTYHPNIMGHRLSIEKWLKYAHLLNEGQDPFVEVAVYYPETYNQLDDSAFRHLYASGFNAVAREVRRVVEVDYLEESLIREGYLDRY